MSFLLIIVFVIAIIWVADKLRGKIGKLVQMESQVSFINEYLLYTLSTETLWIKNCASKEELIHQGQDKLWKHIAIFHKNMEKLSQNGYRLKPGDDELLKQALSIVGTVHLMHAAEINKIIFDKKETDGPSI